MEYIITGFWTALEAFTLMILWQAFFQRKLSKKRYVATLACILVACEICILLLGSQYWNIILFSSIFILSSFIINDGPWYTHVLVIIIGIGTITTTDNVFVYGTSTILSIPASDLMWKKLLYSTVVTIGKLIDLLIAWAVYKIRYTRFSQTFRRKWLLFILLFTTGSVSLLYTMFWAYQDQSDISTSVVIITSFVVVVNIAVIYLVSTLQSSAERTKEMALLNQQLNMQTEQILALERSYRVQRQNTHDFRNQLQTILNMIELGTFEEVRNYAEELLGNSMAQVFVVNSCHPVIDAILNQKYHAGCEHNIDFQIQVNDLSQINFPTDMLVVLLSNLLDNAIEGCCRFSGNRMIQCVLVVENGLFVSIRNTSLPVIIDNGHIPTSKAVKSDHGYGLGRIQYILEKLHAEYIFEYSNGWFTYAAEIPLSIA